MQFRFLAISATGDAESEEDLNRFLRSHRVLAVHREFVSQGENSYWALTVEYLEGPTVGSAGAGKAGGSRVDYKQILSPEDFAVFVKLRQWRKAAAEEDGVPVYTIFTNEQLAEIVRLRVESKAALGKIEGIGEGRLKKYADAVLQVLSESKVTGGSDSVARETASEGDTEGIPPEGKGR